MERIFRIDFYPHEWLAQTGHMTAEQRGVFIQVCALIYASKGKIRNDPHHIGRVANCSSRLARSIIDQLAQTGDLQIHGEFVTQKRCELELNKKRTHLENSSKGGRNKSESNGETSKNSDIVSSEADSTPPSPSPSPSLYPIEDSLRSSSTPLSPKPDDAETDALMFKYVMPDGTLLSFEGFFERMWLLYPNLRDRGHKRKAREQMLKKLNEGVTYETIGRGVSKYRNYCEATGELHPDFFRWLRDDGFIRPYVIPEGAAKPRSADRGAIIEQQTRDALQESARRLGLIE